MCVTLMDLIRTLMAKIHICRIRQKTTFSMGGGGGGGGNGFTDAINKSTCDAGRIREKLVNHDCTVRRVT